MVTALFSGELQADRFYASGSTLSFGGLQSTGGATVSTGTLTFPNSNQLNFGASAGIDQSIKTFLSNPGLSITGPFVVGSGFISSPGTIQIVSPPSNPDPRLSFPNLGLRASIGHGGISSSYPGDITVTITPGGATTTSLISGMTTVPPSNLFLSGLGMFDPNQFVGLGNLGLPGSLITSGGSGFPFYAISGSSSLTSVLLGSTSKDGETFVLTPVDLGAMGQFILSAIPTNQALNGIASGLNNAGNRDFSNRLFRARSRYVSPDGGTASNNPFANRGRDIAASRYQRMESRLTGDTTISLNGRANSSTPNATSSSSAPILSDRNPFLSVEQPAGASLDPSVLATGEKWILWAGTDFGNVELDDLGPNAAGVDSHTYSSSIGLEYAVNDAISLGVGWSHLWNDNTLTRDLGSIDVEGDSAVVYGTWFKDNFWADLLYSYSSNEAETRRNTGLGTTVLGTPDIETHTASLNLGYNMGIDDGRIIHGPTFGASYTEGQVGSYTETGDPRSNTQFAGQEFGSLITRVGYQVNWSQESTIGLLRPQLRIGYGRENLKQEQTTAAALIPNAANNNTFVGVVNGQTSDPGEGWMELGAGISIQLSDTCSLTFDYETQIFRENVSVHYGTAMVRMKF